MVPEGLGSLGKKVKVMVAVKTSRSSGMGVVVRDWC
jgi:hypothetical protein